MSRPNGEPGGFGSSGVFLTRRGASERADDYVALLFSKLGGFCAGRSGEISLSPPLGHSVLGRQVGICGMICRRVWAPAPGAPSCPGFGSRLSAALGFVMAPHEP